MPPLTTPVTLFLASTILFLLVNRKRSKERRPNQDTSRSITPPVSSSDNDSSPHQLSKQEIIHLRLQHFSKNVSVSYSNSSDGGGGLLILRGSKCRLFESSSSSYLDTRNNVAHCGHSHPAIIQAIQRQVSLLNTNTRYLHPNVVVLAQRLTNLLPSQQLTVTFFVNSGSEANDLALRLARNYTKSKNTIVVDGAYHGHTLATLQVSPYKYECGTEFSLKRQLNNTMTPSRHIWKVPCPNVYRGMYRKNTTTTSSNAGELYAQHVVEACEAYTNQYKEKVSAFIMEGGLSVGGVILPPPGYLRKAVSAVHKAGGVYIADEVQTGFGRLGKCFWAFEYGWDEDSEEDVVVPDIVTMGKPFGNGMPLAAVVTTREIADAFASTGVEYFNTFGGNPVCAAAGLAVLDVIQKERLQQNALEVGGYLKNGFIQLQERLDIIGDVRGCGLFLGVELVRNRDTLEPATEETSFLCTKLKEKYFILTSIDGFHENVLVIKPPMVFTKDDADLFLRSFEQAVCEDLAALGDNIRSLAKTPT